MYPLKQLSYTVFLFYYSTSKNFMIPSVVWHLKKTIITVDSYVLQEIIVLIQNNLMLTKEKV